MQSLLSRIAHRSRTARQVQQITEGDVKLAYVEQGYTRESAEDAAAEHGIQMEFVKQAEAKCIFAPPTRR